MKDLLNSLSCKVDRADINTDVYNFFVDYLNSGMINNENYDCYEIAEDFITSLKIGIVYKISSKTTRFFNILEFCNPMMYVDHYVYVHNGIAFDPRMWVEPIYWKDYQQLLKEINRGNNLLFEKER